MPPYYMLKCYGLEPDASADIVLRTRIYSGWFTGQRLTETVPDPVECLVLEPGEMQSMFTGGCLLMTDDLIAALRGAGVDNLDVYNAVIRNDETGETWSNYKSVNIVGVISAVDLPRSTPLERAGELIDVPFEGIAIDPARAGGALMFRLAEAVAGIVVDERVKSHLEAAGFRDLTFLEPSQWMG
jgi:hypothetical protein